MLLICLFINFLKFNIVFVEAWPVNRTWRFFLETQNWNFDELHDYSHIPCIKFLNFFVYVFTSWPPYYQLKFSYHIWIYAYEIVNHNFSGLGLAFTWNITESMDEYHFLLFREVQFLINAYSPMNHTFPSFSNLWYDICHLCISYWNIFAYFLSREIYN